jgi:hypothetical protein
VLKNVVQHHLESQSLIGDVLHDDDANILLPRHYDKIFKKLKTFQDPTHVV